MVKLPRRLGTGLPELDAVRPKADSGTNTTKDEATIDLQYDDHLSSDDETPTVEGIPMVNVTGPDSEPPQEWEEEVGKIPVPVEPEGPARCFPGCGVQCET